MTGFIVKGLLRDRQRSLLPIIVVTTGVALSVLVFCWIKGVFGDFIVTNADFSTGHVKVVTRAYEENMDQRPLDLALGDVQQLTSTLSRQFPTMAWVPRIHFGGLVDVPDAQGETKEQGTAVGMGVDLLSTDSAEIKRMKLQKSLVQGNLPQKAGEVLISNELADKLDVTPGDSFTIIASTMYGSMTMTNVTVSGTLSFGIKVLDRGALIMDLADCRQFLNMEDACSELLGYFPDNQYHHERARHTADSFNKDTSTEDPFAPFMLTLKGQNDLGSLMDYLDQVTGLMFGVFILAMSIVLWNTSLIGGLRRYGEVGVRLAIGESKHHIYGFMIAEALCIGIVGSVLGTALGMAFAWYLQTYGIDVSAFTEQTSMMVPTVYRARILPAAYFLGFVPGLASTVLGTALAGIGIYRRKTAQLFKELEA